MKRATLESYEKNQLNVAAKNREEHFQTYLSNWLWHYDCNDSAKYNSRFNLFELKAFIVEYATLESYKKKSVECRNKDQSREFSELSFKLALAL